MKLTRYSAIILIFAGLSASAYEGTFSSRVRCALAISQLAVAFSTDTPPVMPATPEKDLSKIDGNKSIKDEQIRTMDSSLELAFNQLDIEKLYERASRRQTQKTEDEFKRRLAAAKTRLTICQDIPGIKALVDTKLRTLSNLSEGRLRESAPRP